MWTQQRRGSIELVARILYKMFVICSYFTRYKKIKHIFFLILPCGVNNGQTFLFIEWNSSSLDECYLLYDFYCHACNKISSISYWIMDLQLLPAFHFLIAFCIVFLHTGMYDKRCSYFHKRWWITLLSSIQVVCHICDVKLYVLSIHTIGVLSFTLFSFCK